MRPHGPDPQSVARGLRWGLGWVVGIVVRAWLATLRLDVRAHPALESVAHRPWVLAFFHGSQWPLLGWRRRRPTLVMVSWSLDGTLQSRALRTLGLEVVRGSSSRGGMRGLAELTRRLKRGAHDAAFAVDGPRGPYGVAKGGALVAARSAGGVVVPMGSALRHGLVLRRAWDRFGIAWPFTRVAVVLGAPLDPVVAGVERTSDLEAAIAAANVLARGLLDGAALAVTPALQVAYESDVAGVVTPSK